MTIVAGIDGCPGGWLMVSREMGSAEAEIRLEPAWPADGLCAAVVCVDMPIGLMDAGPRECDILARRALGRARGASVFPAPNRPMLGLATWEQANAWGKSRGRGLSRQSWGLMDKIRELDRALQSDDQRRV